MTSLATRVRGALAPRRLAARWLRWSVVALLAIALVVPLVLPLLTGRPLTVVDGGSMEPTLHRGDVLVTRSATTADLQLGHILVVGTPPDRYTHRVVAIDTDGDRLRLQGDANAVPDLDWVSTGDVDAAVMMTISGLPAVLVRSVTSPPGVMALVVLLAVLLLPPRRVRPSKGRGRVGIGG